jgi:hypothetical protein
LRVRFAPQQAKISSLRSAGTGASIDQHSK